MPTFTRRGQHYFDGKGQGYLFPPTIEEAGAEKIFDGMKKVLPPDKLSQVMDYAVRQSGITPHRPVQDILREMVSVPVGEAEWLHPMNFPGIYASRAISLIAERIVRATGSREDAGQLAERLEKGLKEWVTYPHDALEKLIQDPKLVESVDFRADKRSSDDKSTRRAFMDALTVRGQDAPAEEDRELRIALSKIPFPRIDAKDVGRIKGVLLQAR
ncbi:MAG: hypothetical protein ABIH11_00810 [Candidatus Altiarchaeota archaeon]